MSDETYPIRDYTEAFVVHKALRKLGRIHIPLREGLFVRDLKVFGAVLVVWLILFGIVLNAFINTIARLLGADHGLTGVPYLMLLFTPPVLAAAASRQPIRHNLTVFGLIRAAVRHHLDDPLHRRGVPVRSTHGPETYYARIWTADSTVLPELSSRLPQPNRIRVGPPPTHQKSEPAGGTTPPQAGDDDPASPLLDSADHTYFDDELVVRRG